MKLGAQRQGTRIRRREGLRPPLDMLFGKSVYPESPQLYKLLSYCLWAPSLPLCSLFSGAGAGILRTAFPLWPLGLCQPLPIEGASRRKRGVAVSCKQWFFVPAVTVGCITGFPHDNTGFFITLQAAPLRKSLTKLCMVTPRAQLQQSSGSFPKSSGLKFSLSPRVINASCNYLLPLCFLSVPCLPFQFVKTRSTDSLYQILSVRIPSMIFVSSFGSCPF